jgi:hypothetical protein
MPADCTAAPQNSIEVDVHDLRPLFVRGLFCRSVNGDASIVNQEVDAVKVLEYLLHHCVDLIRSADVYAETC